MSRTDWKDEGYDHQPKFGRKARAWYARLVATWIREHMDKSWHDDDGMRRLGDWYMARRERFATWHDDSDFRGGQYSCGAWSIDWAAVAASEKDAVAECNSGIDEEDRADGAARSAADAARFPTLDEWLQADRLGMLVYLGAEGGMPLVARNRAEASNQRTCTACGTCFSVPSPRKLRLCESCRAKRPRHARRIRKQNPDKPRGVFLVHKSRDSLGLEAYNASGEIIDACVAKPGREYRAAVKRLWDELDQQDPPACSR